MTPTASLGALSISSQPLALSRDSIQSPTSSAYTSLKHTIGSSTPTATNTSPSLNRNQMTLFPLRLDSLTYTCEDDYNEILEPSIQPDHLDLGRLRSISGAEDELTDHILRHNTLILQDAGYSKTRWVAQICSVLKDEALLWFYVYMEGKTYSKIADWPLFKHKLLEKFTCRLAYSQMSRAIRNVPFDGNIRELCKSYTYLRLREGRSSKDFHNEGNWKFGLWFRLSDAGHSFDYDRDIRMKKLLEDKTSTLQDLINEILITEDIADEIQSMRDRSEQSTEHDESSNASRGTKSGRNRRGGYRGRGRSSGSYRSQ